MWHSGNQYLNHKVDCKTNLNITFVAKRLMCPIHDYKIVWSILDLVVLCLGTASINPVQKEYRPSAICYILCCIKSWAVEMVSTSACRYIILNSWKHDTASNHTRKLFLSDFFFVPFHRAKWKSNQVTLGWQPHFVNLNYVSLLTIKEHILRHFAKHCTNLICRETNLQEIMTYQPTRKRKKKTDRTLMSKLS